MKYDTAGRRIYELVPNCNCGLTGGCRYCRPSFIGCIDDEEANDMKKKLEDYKIRFNNDFEKKRKELFK